VALQIYNTMSGKKEAFVPLQPGQAKMYVCGPTVYDFLHVGNFRGPVFFNLVRNWLEKSGYKVTFVYNYTDVDDRIIERARKDGVPSEEVAGRFIREFEADYSALKLRPHDHNPTVTAHIPAIRDLVASLVEGKRAYARDGEVFYSVRSFADYGKLSHKNVDDLQAGARVEVDGKKIDPLDFSLWKPAKPGEPKWPSPWGDGRPGWHIECSAMIREILGESIDIHGGGLDLVFPHHENEIAQSEGASGKPFVKYWMHNNMVNFGAQKMSKSIGNVRTARNFLGQYNGEILKYLLLSSHYRSIADFSEKQVMGAVAGLARVYSALALANSLVTAGEAAKSGLFAANAEAGAPGGDASAAASASGGKVAAALEKALAEQSAAVASALDDDFNTPAVFAAIYVAVRAFNTQFRRGQKATPDAQAAGRAFTGWVRAHGEPMSLFQEPAEGYLRLLDDMLLGQKQLVREAIAALGAERAAARAAKDWALGDQLRKKLDELGIALQDSPSGTHWEVQKT
jgi:cysteinyl-tRNA synthetase